ncbi:RNA ligase family protein [Streptodolium elevatio]|uniref:RNA ligase family protein n=1 Tax=Streptodolium elevatio TaxID=3157996 RepID=A0ABV3DPV2_9ACTN
MSDAAPTPVPAAAAGADAVGAAAHGPVLRPYPKIPARGGTSASGVREWAAAEKVHGAHFAVVCDAAGARPAKRRELLGDDDLDAFFGVSRIWPALAVAAERFAATLRVARGFDGFDGFGDGDGDGAAAADPAPVVTLYGELAGGAYPHPDVPAEPGVDPVQTGVWYAPGLHWLLFDATVESSAASVDAADGRVWIADRTLRTFAATAGLACVPLLAYGPRHSLDDLPRVFPTRVPGRFGLPELDGNLAEGYVVKPAGEWREAGARERSEGPGVGGRPVVKVKQPAFAEDRRYSGARPYLPPPQGAAGVPSWLVLQAAALLTPARAAGAVSKTGPRTPLDTVADEIARDAADETAAAVGGLDRDQLRSLTAALLPGARALARFDAADRGAASTGGRRPENRNRR